jgi:hypothetical protein
MAKHKSKILYIENLRIVLSALVVIVHMACTYGGPGGWAYEEKGAGLETVLPLTILNATSQSFFMGMFFLFGAYFTHISFQKKGLWQFVKDRFIRLGIPLALTYYIISPFTSWLVLPIKRPQAVDISFIDYLINHGHFGVGVMWFAEALIYFSIIYIFARPFIPWLHKNEKLLLRQIHSFQIFVAAALLGLITFLARLEFPLFSGGHGTNFNLGHFPQYTFLFILGVIAAKYKTDQILPIEQAKKWLWFSAGMIIVGLPLLFFTGGADGGDLSPYFGGLTWQSFGFSIWEQITGISIMVSLIGIFKAIWNWQNKMQRILSGSAYAVYVFHPPVIVWVSIQFVNWDIMHLIKFMTITPLALVASYIVAILVKRIPGLNRIF